jgi:hypothetical protein
VVIAIVPFQLSARPDESSAYFTQWKWQKRGAHGARWRDGIASHESCQYVQWRAGVSTSKFLIFARTMFHELKSIASKLIYQLPDCSKKKLQVFIINFVKCVPAHFTNIGRVE